MNFYWPDTGVQLGKTVVMAAVSNYDPSNRILMVGLLDYKKGTWATFDMNTAVPRYTLKIKHHLSLQALQNFPDSAPQQPIPYHHHDVSSNHYALPSSPLSPRHSPPNILHILLISSNLLNSPMPTLSNATSVQPFPSIQTKPYPSISSPQDTLHHIPPQVSIHVCHWGVELC